MLPKGTLSREGAWGSILSMPFLSNLIVAFFFFLGQTVVVPTLPLVIDAYGLSLGGGALMLSSYALGRLAFDLVSGVLGDRFGIRRAAVAGCVITIAASVFAATTPAYSLMLAARVAQGMGSALYATAALTYVIAIAPQSHIGRLLALYHGVILAAASLGPTVGGFTAQWWGIPGPFLLITAFGIIGAASAFLFLPAHEEPATNDAGVLLPAGKQLRLLLSDFTFLLMLLACFAVYFVRTGITDTIFPLFAAERLGFSPALIGLMLSAAAVGQLAVLVRAGRSVDGPGWRRILLIGLWGTVPIVACLIFVNSAWLLFVLAALLGGAKGFTLLVPGAVLAELASPKIRGTAIGLQRTASDFGQFIGPVVLGSVADRAGYEGSALFTAALVGTVACVAWVYTRKRYAIGPEPT